MQLVPPGVVDQDVDRPERVLDAVARRRDGVEVGHVERHRGGAAARAFDLFGGRVGLLLAQVADGDRAPGVGQGEGDGAPDAARGPGHQGDAHQREAAMVA